MSNPISFSLSLKACAFAASPYLSNARHCASSRPTQDVVCITGFFPLLQSFASVDYLFGSDFSRASVHCMHSFLNYQNVFQSARIIQMPPSELWNSQLLHILAPDAIDFFFKFAKLVKCIRLL